MSTSPSFESFIDRQIREAAERGEFDDLAGAGAPLESLGPVYDPEWWARKFIKQEQVRSKADELRRRIRDELPRLRVIEDRTAAHAKVDEINEAVTAVNEHLPPADQIPPVEL
jgi:hypothetical protein